MGPELLLSFAFLLDHLKLMEPSPRRVPMRLPPYPQDISGESAKEENVGTCREKSRNVSVHAILQLHTKYRNTMRRLQGLEAGSGVDSSPSLCVFERISLLGKL